jgi:release factor glutamine methyltransferase
LVKVALSFVEKKQKFQRDLTIIDMGTGCGNIAVSLAMNAENVKILASDISPAAVELAQVNVDKFKLQQRISLFCGDLFSPFHGSGYEGKIDMVVCNPPYIPTTSLSKLPSEIIDYEPTVALDAGAYGIGFFRRLISDSVTLLKPGGILVFEIGAGQEKLVTRLIQRSKTYGDIGFFDDGEQIRVISTTKKVGVRSD